MEAKKIILQFICPDKAGILSAATQFLFKRNAFMTEVSSFSDNAVSYTHLTLTTIYSV